jgi:hypothetical protein
MLRLWRKVQGLHLAYFSKPAARRPLYRLVRRPGVCKLLQLGLGDLTLAERLISLATAANPQARVEFTGVDLFEMRRPEDGPGMSLKLAHRRLSETTAKVRLIPGDPYSALARSANALGGQNVVLISADQQPESLSKAWFYLPRVLAKGASVFVESHSAEGDTSAVQVESLPLAEVEQRASKANRLRAAA